MREREPWLRGLCGAPFSVQGPGEHPLSAAPEMKGICRGSFWTLSCSPNGHFVPFSDRCHVGDRDSESFHPLSIFGLLNEPVGMAAGTEVGGGVGQPVGAGETLPLILSLGSKDTTGSWKSSSCVGLAGDVFKLPPARQEPPNPTRQPNDVNRLNEL